MCSEFRCVVIGDHFEGLASEDSESEVGCEDDACDTEADVYQSRSVSDASAQQDCAGRSARKEDELAKINPCTESDGQGYRGHEHQCGWVSVDDRSGECAEGYGDDFNVKGVLGSEDGREDGEGQVEPVGSAEALRLFVLQLLIDEYEEDEADEEE